MCHATEEPDFSCVHHDSVNLQVTEGVLYDTNFKFDVDFMFHFYG